MPKSIACPGCRRVLSLPDDVMNTLVQCPACKQSFHPAAADAAAARAAVPKVDFAAASAPAAPPPRPATRPPAPPPAEAPVRRSRRREEYDICPKCRARVPQGATRCPECNVEFEPEDADRPWERVGEERRDSDPHRGGVIVSMGVGSIVLPLVFWCPVAGLVATIVGIFVGAGAWVMAVKDMRKMDKHQMDRRGRGLTQGGMICGIIGTCLNIAGLCAATPLTIMYLMN
jgi:ribosomal protein L40E